MSQTAMLWIGVGVALLGVGSQFSEVRSNWLLFAFVVLAVLCFMPAIKEWMGMGKFSKETMNLLTRFIFGAIGFIVVFVATWMYQSRTTETQSIDAQPTHPVAAQVIEKPVPPTSTQSTIGDANNNSGIIVQNQSGGTNTIINRVTPQALSPKAKKELKARIQKTKELRISVNQFIATMTVLRDNAILNPNTMHEINEFDQEMGRILRQHLGHDEGTAIQVRITNVRMATNVQIDTQRPPVPRQADYHARVRFENLTNLNRELDATIRDLESRL